MPMVDGCVKLSAPPACGGSSRCRDAAGPAQAICIGGSLVLKAFRTSRPDGAAAGERT